MANLPQQNTIVQYVADGIEDTYIVPFFTPEESDGFPNIDVFTQAADAVPVPESDIKLWSVDYTYTANLDPITGGNITFLPGKIPPNGYIVTIVRDVQAALDVEFSQAQNFSGFTLDAALDKLLLISQQNKSYALERNLSYIVNTYLPDETISANVQIPILLEGQVWFGSSNGVIAVTLQQSSDVSTLRSELANEAPVTNGAHLVGYYDSVNLNPTTVEAQLTYLTGFILSGLPSGAMIDFGGTVAPTGFLLCDGAAVSRVTYDELFAVIGVGWGNGNGTTTFNVPDIRGFVTAGAGGTLPPLTNTVGSTGGSATHTQTIAEMPAHTHPPLSSGGFAASLGSTGFASGTGGLIYNATTGTRGGGDPFTIVQPTKIVLKIIKT